jgi:hypothetical protein
MSNSRVYLEGSARRLIVLVIALSVFAALPLLASARTASITIVNNSSREVAHVYLSHSDQDDWGQNQLGESSIGSGQSFTISNVSWDQPQLKVVAEDGDGCFLYGIVSTTDGSTWTITNNTARDCGGN